MLLELVNDVLIINKIDSGAFELEKKKFNLADIVNEVKSMTEVQAAEKKIEFETIGHETQAKIVRTLLSYDKCHIEHAKGKNVVTPSWCICDTCAKDSWISQDFYRKTAFSFHLAAGGGAHTAFRGLSHSRHRAFMAYS